MKLLAIIAFLACVCYIAAYEGIYNINDNATFIVCEESGRYHGMWSEAYSFQARWNPVAGYPVGYYYGPGYKWGSGQQNSKKNFIRDTGRFLMSLDTNTSVLTVLIKERKGSVIYTLTLDMETSTVTDRDANCGIIDYNTTETLTGTWIDDLGATVDAEVGSNPTTGKSLKRLQAASLTFNYTINVYGSCAKWGKICSYDYSYYDTDAMFFGVGIGVLLQDGTVRFFNWAGLPASYSYYDYVSNTAWHNAYIFTRTGDDSVLPAAYTSFAYNPLKCKSFTADECEIQEGFGACVYTEGDYDSDFYDCTVAKY